VVLSPSFCAQHTVCRVLSAARGLSSAAPRVETFSTLGLSRIL